MSSMPRRRLQRAFIQWLAVNRHRFRIPISIANRADSRVLISLAGINAAIQVSMSQSKFTGWSRGLLRTGGVRQFLTGFPAGSYEHAFDEIVVAVNYEGVCWDLLTSIEVIEIHQPDGYCCGLCDPAYRKLYATRTEFWGSSAESVGALAYFAHGKLTLSRLAPSGALPQTPHSP